MSNAIVVLLLSVFLISPRIAPAAGVENAGAENIMISGGNRGDVHFSHRRHQGQLNNCKPCHELFPKAHGSINAFKSEGKLSKNQVMDTLCIDCHRTKRKAGEQSGPVTCNLCHTK